MPDRVDQPTRLGPRRAGLLQRAASWALVVGLALAGLGVAAVFAINGRWTSIRALVAEGGALLVPLALIGVGTLVFLVGLVAYVFAPTRSREEAAASYARLPMVVATLAVAAIPANLIALIYLAASGRAGEGGAPSPVVLLVSVIPLEASLLLVLYLRIVRPGVLTWREMGLSAGRIGTHLGQGFGAYLLILVSVAAINFLLQSVGIRQTQAQSFQGVQAASVPELLALILAAGVLAPIAEEAFFRGYVFTAYLRTRGRAIAYLLSAGLFAVVHLNLPALPAIFAVGLILALLFDLTKSLIPGIVAHGLNNSVAFLILFLAPGSLPQG